MCKNTAGTLRICVEHIAYDGETSSYIIIDVQLIFWQTERRNGNFQNFDTKYGLTEFSALTECEL